MDDIDLDVLRWMYPGGVWSPWGTDPRITIADIASHVGLTRTAVWARLCKWRKVEFWDGFETQVNPRIFGASVSMVSFHVEDSAQGWELLDRTGAIQGVMWASLLSGYSLAARNVTYVLVTMLADTRADQVRRMRALRRLSPSGVVDGPVTTEPVPCSRSMTPLDWRILSAMVAHPNASAARLACDVGVSLKTLDHHRSLLIDDGVVCSTPRLDWSKIGCVALTFFCRSPEDVDVTVRALESRLPHSIPVSFQGLNGHDFKAPKCFCYLVPAHSPHAVPSLVHDLSRLPGVTSVLPELWGARCGFTAWATSRIAQRLCPPVTVMAATPASAVGPGSGGPGRGVREERPALVPA
ncbi:MAG TPA: Lrp/AsnC family transcriptional regulator [Thermoplasmata archaeon]|nr:Lrp/AsnC family transcriptional regulator [Thermoplasmata archaeon]